MFMKFLTAGAGLAALAAAAPASAQYGYGYGYQQPYGNAYGYYNNRANVTQFAVQQCTAAVQQRLNARGRGYGLENVLGSVFGVNPGARGQVLTVSSVRPSSSRIRVRGLATSGRMAYNPYGYGYYGAQGYGYANAADLSFRCDVDYRGRVRDIDFNRRR